MYVFVDVVVSDVGYAFVCVFVICFCIYIWI